MRAAERVIAYTILLIPLVVVCLGFWPGHMSADSLAQYLEAREGGFNNQHAPLLVMLWWLGYHTVNAGPGWVLVLQVSACLSGCYLLLRTLLRPWIAATVTAVIALLPQVYGMLGYVSRDMWYTGLLLLTFGMVARAGQRTGRVRIAWLIGAVVAAWLTLASRQNAAPSVVIALALGAALVLPRLAERRSGRSARFVRRRPVIAAVVAGCAVTVALMATQFVANPALGVADVDPQQQLYLYDLIGMSLDEHENMLPPQVLADRRVSMLQSYWNIDTVGTYIFGSPPLIPVPMSPENMTTLTKTWRDEVLDHPLTYLDVRTDLFLRQIGITRPAYYIYHPQIDPNDMGLKIRFPELNNAAKDYVQAFAINPSLDGWFIYDVWIYLLLAAVAAIVLLRRGRAWGALVAGGLALSALTYQSGLYVGAMATQFRWEFTALLSAILTIPFLVAVIRDRASGRRRYD